MKKFIKLSIVITLISIQTTMYSQNFINDNKRMGDTFTYSTKADLYIHIGQPIINFPEIQLLMDFHTINFISQPIQAR